MRKTLAILLLAGTTFLAGCGDSDEFVFTPQNPGGVTAPVCQDDAYTTNQNTQLTVNAANGVLANDTPNGGTVTAFDATSTQNGTVNVNGNGSFTYTPANGFTGSDSFTYTLANSGGQVTCTVTITVQAVNGYFVDATNGNDGTGSFNGGLPFATVQAAVANAPTNADIVVRPGNYTGTVNLKDGQRLLGSGSTLVSTQGATRPQLTGPVDLADGNTLDFLRINGTNADAVDGDGQNGGTISNCEIANINNNGDGVSLDNTSGNWELSNNAISNVQGTGVGIGVITSGTDSAVYVVDNNVITGNESAAILFISETTSDVRASVINNTLQGNSTVIGDAFELSSGDNSMFCLNLENNVNDTDTNSGNGEDGVYRVGEFNSATLRIEQLNNLTDPQPGGAGNTGTVNDSSTGTIEDVANGTCGF